jgi:iron complex transport system permease protein
MTTREFVMLVLLAAALCVAFLASLAVGSSAIPIARVVDALIGGGAPADRAIVTAVRLPRAATAILAGAALGIAGLQMQTLFRNPLADPFALGVSSGASLGVAVIVLGAASSAADVFGSSTGLVGDALVTAAAIAGAAAVLVLVLAVSSRIADATAVLILGLMFGYAVSACVTVLVGGSEPERLQQWAQWGLGSFAGVTWPRLQLFAPITILGLVIATVTPKQLNALLLGERYARSMGLGVMRARVLTMAGASVLAAVVTAFCGPISFIGIAVPHLCRGLLGTADHRVVVPAVVLMGAVVALTAQIVSVLPGDGAVLPLNAVTALIGAPTVVFILLRQRRSGAAA